MDSPAFPPSEAAGPPCPVEPSVWQRLQKAAADHPGRLAVASLHQPAGLYGVGLDFGGAGHLRWSYSDLLAAVAAFSGSLARAGVERGTAFATLLDSSVEFVLAFWTAHRLGCPFVPLSPRSLVNDGELAHMLRVAGVSLVLVKDSDTARRLDAAAKGHGLSLKMVASDAAPDRTWVALGGLLAPEAAAPGQGPTPAEAQGHADELVSVLFTSGTTSLPKGVPHTNTTLNAFCQNLALGGRSAASVYCTLLPCNHAMGYFYPLHFMMAGAAVVYPSPRFDAVATVRALESANVTHTALVPTALDALLEVIEARDRRLESSLLDVSLSGSAISPDIIRRAFTHLGSSGVSTGFGMTEGSPIWTGRTEDPEQLIRGDLAVAGRPSPGARVRICAPGSREPLPQGVPGEMHQSGPGVVSAYLGDDVAPEHFYRDEDGRRWFVTGDQAVMHPDGRFSITGRCKDMIIRGGENISPAAIEAVLARQRGLQAQVVGVPDPVAGEVPVAVVRHLGGASVKSVQDAVLGAMGAAFVPERVVTLQELGLDEFPTTTSSKVQKAKLAHLVRCLLGAGDAAADDADKSVENKLLLAYHKSTGIPVDGLDTELPASVFADSISAMRVRAHLRKSWGLHLTAQDMAAHETIAAQVRLLQRRGAQTGRRVARPAAERAPGPTADDMGELLGGAERAALMRERISAALARTGLAGFDDVAAVFPAHDYMQVLLQSTLIDTWNFGIAVLTTAPSVPLLRAALEKALANHPILTSLCVYDEDGVAHYVTLRPSEALWDMCVVDHGSVGTPACVGRLAVEYPFPQHSRAPGPLFRCLVVRVDETDSAAVVMNVHHLVQDVSSMRLFLEDVEQALSDPAADLAPHTDIQAWQDSYAALRLSPAATASVNYHVRRLAGLPRLLRGLYPPAAVPRRANPESPDGLDVGFDAPGLLDLRRAHPGICAAVVVKAAMALANVARTGHSHALFCNFEAGRGRFPFAPPSVAALAPATAEASDVNGPVMQAVCNAIPVARDEPGLDFLRRLQAEQTQLTRHAHAPLRRVLAELDAAAAGAGDAVVEVHRAQFLTWVPGLLGEYERLRVAQIAIRCAAGLVVVAALGGPSASTFQLSMRWDAANYSRRQTAEYADDLKTAVVWLTRRHNWQRPVGACVELLGSGDGRASCSGE